MIGIIGYGVVGKALHKSFKNDVVVNIYDPMKGHTDDISNCDVVFICLPTPTKSGKQDDKLIIKTAEKYPSALVVIRSTVLPTSEVFSLGNVIASPEFLNQHDPYYPQKTILGVNNMFQADTYCTHTGTDSETIEITNPRCAMMVKYVHNCFGALKVTFFNEIYDICKKEDLDYREMKRLLFWTNDNVGKQYTKIAVDGERGFGNTCFPKDSTAFLGAFDCKTLEAAVLKNVEYRPKLMLDKIEGEIL
jgi:UDPglucose 6-dehydrogenase